MNTSDLVQQIVNPAVVDKVIGAVKVSPEKALAKVKKAKAKTEAKTKAVKVVSELNQLRAELKALSGAPVSPLMTIEQIKASIDACNVEKTREALAPETKEKVIPSKPQGIGAFCITQLKAKVAPKDVLAQVKEKFPTAKTSMACVYWYASKINQGLL